MDLIVIILVKSLDPISFAIVFGLCFISREKWIISAAAIAGAMAVEAILLSTQVTRSFGQGLMFGIPVGFIHAGLSYWLIGKFTQNTAKSKPDDSPD